ncbi:MAG: peptidoglycan DD-metalloendopeptidase family protein [Motilibacteraceae bacterium]
MTLPRLRPARPLRLRWAAGLAVAGLALSAGLTGAGAAAAQDDRAAKSKVDQRIGQLKGQLADSSAEAAQAAATLERTRAALAQAQQAVAAAQSALAAARAKEKALADQVAQVQADVERSAAEIAATQAHMDQVRDELGSMARQQYMTGGTGQLQLVDLLLSAKDMASFAEAKAITGAVANKQNGIVLDLIRTAQRLADEKARLEARQAQLTTLHDQAAQAVAASAALADQAAAATAKVATLEKQQAAALATIEREKAREQAALLSAQRESAALAKRIAEAQRRLAAQLAAQRRSSAAASRGGGGSLTWPANGPMVMGVGPRINPATGSRSCHSGMDIAAGYGAPIVAAADGVVVDTSYSAWDGNVTVIAHAGGLTTWYAHQSSRAVADGQTVRAGQVIGYVGATGFATGPHLHFDTVVNGVVMDPMGWFGGAMRQVAPLCGPGYPSPVP